MKGRMKGREGKDEGKGRMKGREGKDEGKGREGKGK